MKQNGLLVFFALLFCVAQMDGRDRGHASAGGWAPFRQPGAVMGPGIGGHRMRGHGAFGFGVGRSGLGFRRSWPLFGSGLGVYYSEYHAPSQSRDSDAALDSEEKGSPNIYYYQKPPESGLKPNCKDTWTQTDKSSSLSNFMNRMFELQCQNRHPEGESNPPPSPAPAKN